MNSEDSGRRPQDSITVAVAAALSKAGESEFDLGTYSRTTRIHDDVDVSTYCTLHPPAAMPADRARGALPDRVFLFFYLKLSAPDALRTHGTYFRPAHRHWALGASPVDGRSRAPAARMDGRSSEVLPADIILGLAAQRGNPSTRMCKSEYRYRYRTCQAPPARAIRENWDSDWDSLGELGLGGRFEG